MIFSLVSSAQEWLNIRWDEFKAGEEDRAQAKLKEFEEAERVSSKMYNGNVILLMVLLVFVETLRGYQSDGRNVSGLAKSV